MKLAQLLKLVAVVDRMGPSPYDVKLLLASPLASIVGDAEDPATAKAKIDTAEKLVDGLLAACEDFELTEDLDELKKRVLAAKEIASLWE